MDEKNRSAGMTAVAVIQAEILSTLAEGLARTESLVNVPRSRVLKW